MKRSLALILSAGLLLGPAVHRARAAANTEAVQLLLKHARYWNAHGRQDLAVQNWKQVLQAAPDQKRALAGVGLYAAQQGRFDAARKYAGRLRRAAPGSPAAVRIRQLLAVGDAAAPAIRRAAKARQAQNYGQAVAAYEDAFQGPPPPAWADAYDQALAHSSQGGWSDAVAAARAQHKRNPDEAGYRLALGRLLTQHADTRGEGVKMLARLVRHGGPWAPPAQAAWRQGLAWMGNNPSAIPELRRYLAKHSDAGLRRQLHAAEGVRRHIAKRQARGRKLAAAYRQLKAGRLDAAQAAFTALVKAHPDSAKAREGLADVAMRRKDFVTAARQYAHAASVAKTAARRRHLRASETRAKYWGWMQAGDRARKAGDSSPAIRAYRQALTIRAQDPTALAALGTVYQHQGRSREAVKRFSELARTRPGDLRGWISLLAALRQLGRPKAVLAAAARMPDTLHAKARTHPVYAGALAWARSETGHPRAGIDDLRPAIAAHPGGASLALRIQLGWLLYRTHQDTALYHDLQQLRTEPELGKDRRKQVRHLYLDAAEREAKAALEHDDDMAARAIVAHLSQVYPGDPGVARVRASLLLEQHHFDKADAIYRRVGPRRTAAGYRAAAGTALAANDNRHARRWADAGLRLAPGDADLAVLSARADLAGGHGARARRTVHAALDRLPPARESAPEPTTAVAAAYPFARTPPPQSGATAHRASAPGRKPAYPFAGRRTRAPAAGTAARTRVELSPAQAAAARTKLESELAVINARTASNVGNALYGRSRSGTSGLDRLGSVADQFRAGLALSTRTRLAFRAAWVHVGAGSLGGPAAGRIGSAPLTGPEPGDYVHANGVGFAAGLTHGGFGFGLGVTPRGFPVHGLLAHLRWHPDGSPFTVEAFRHAVRDSVLSYAGVTDPHTGLTWGGVFANGARVSFGRGSGERYGYFSVSAAALDGRNVQHNARLELDGGAMWPVGNSDTPHIGAGFDVLAMGYQHDSSHFTYGQGGYFSPSYYLRPSATVAVRGVAFGRLSYVIRGRAGWQLFHRASSAYFPTDAAWQSPTGNPHYAGDTVQGLGYGVTARATWSWQRRLFLTGFLSSDNSQNYSDVRAGVVLSYSFAPSADAAGKPMPAPGFADPWLFGLDNPGAN